MKEIPEEQWHLLKRENILSLLESNQEQGLEQQEAEQRFSHFGPNVLTSKAGKSPLVRFLLQFHQPLIYILIVSGVITALLQEWVDSGVIFGVVLANGIIGFIQESKAESSLAALAQTMVAEATVLRSGKKQQIPSTELVPGDLVLLTAGDRVPADMRLFHCRDLQVAESALTGESVPVAKDIAPLPEDTPLAERTNMAYASTMVTYGQARGIVTATGDQTEVGRISQLISTAQNLATPLTRKIDQFSQVLLYAILGLAALTVAVGLLRGQPLFDLFMAAVALAVGAIPEGLPAAVTITLAIGVSRMAKRRAIIRKLPAVETLGSTTVICSDKTGTLTENQMTVQAIIAGQEEYAVSGSGYAPQGEIRLQSDQTENHQTDQDLAVSPSKQKSLALHHCLRVAALCNDGVLQEKEEGWQIQGDPTEGALLTVAGKAGCGPEELKTRYPRLDSIPFESEHQFMATLHEEKADEAGVSTGSLVYIKGAVEQILAKCENVLTAEGGTAPLEKDQIHEEVTQLAARGLRVLAFAEKSVEATTSVESNDVQDGFTFLGLMGMIDPPRAEAVAAVKTCRQAGIRIKMITGDHPATAAAIAGQIGLADEHKNGEQPAVLTGSELEKIADQDLIAATANTDVFARATPEQKIRLVRALQATGNVVAMTGDGVNDAPALKQADIGVAMGITGTDVSKEAADMVLTDDNFSSIEAAVEEGRAVFDNLTKFIVWTLPTNLGEGLVILAAIFFGLTLPILPVQILWINMTTAGFLGLMLAFEPKEPGIMRRKPRDPDTPILTSELIIRIFLVGTLLLIGAFGLFQWELAQGASLDTARTVAVNVFIMMELFYLFNCRSLTKSIFQLGLFTNLWVFAGVSAMLLIQMVYTYVPIMQQLFHSTSIGIGSWARIMLAGVIGFLIVEAEKKLRAG
ncbi:MAG: cation-transporting P-type ATPase [Candidatus Electrothrix aestuarii]|uniref:Cation-transporting P-type ATPase n=1 Tax=Candidatus Electrothrix aestuarii TaxID=3062594 RepID=A0AAU8M0J0_9BACT|nr:cation-transporting P-type ATPase [Candidatus Electrothrix aestuarii]